MAPDNACDAEKPIKSVILVFGKHLKVTRQAQQMPTLIPAADLSSACAAMEAEAAPLIEVLGLKQDDPPRFVTATGLQQSAATIIEANKHVCFLKPWIWDGIKGWRDCCLYALCRMAPPAPCVSYSGEHAGMQVHVIWNGRDKEHGMDLIGTGVFVRSQQAATAATQLERHANPGGSAVTCMTNTAGLCMAAAGDLASL